MQKLVNHPHKILLLAGLILVLAAAVYLPSNEAVASFTASLVCESTYDGAICEARPLNTSYSYAWSTSGYLRIPSPCSGPFCAVSCWGGGSGGYVHVTITAPGGYQDSASRWVRCLNNGPF